MKRRVDERILLSRAYLSRVGEPGNYALWRFIDEVGAVEAARAIRSGSAPSHLAPATMARRETADPAADLDCAEQRGMRLLVPEGDEWPHLPFAALSQRAEPAARGMPALVPPVALWTRGNADLAQVGQRSVAVVGSRSATSYGTHVTAQMCFGLAAQGVAIVSGGAYGIDAAAHRAALAGNGVTLIVSAGGIDRPYPPSHAALFERALENGAVVSESPPGSAPHRSRFLSRNRLIAALGTGVVVVEAALRSGARNTANHAVALGRPLMVVPGPVTSAMSAGCHQMLLDPVSGAQLVTCWEDVLGVVGEIGEQLPAIGFRPHPSGDLRDELDRLDHSSRRVFDALLLQRHLSVPEIASRSGVPPLEVIRCLPGLELSDVIEGSGGKYRVAARVREKSRGTA